MDSFAAAQSRALVPFSQGPAPAIAGVQELKDRGTPPTSQGAPRPFRGIVATPPTCGERLFPVSHYATYRSLAAWVPRLGLGVFPPGSQDGIRFNTRETCAAYQRPLPAGVRMPRSLNAAAIPLRLVTPAACSSFTMGARSAALSLARVWRSSMPARRTAGVKQLRRL
jgi:hypothetical protein